MELVGFDPELAGALARCYDETMADAPHHHLVSPDWFAELPSSQWQHCAEEQLLAAREAGEVVGFVHVGMAAPPADEWEIQGEPGVLRALCYRPGRRAAGAALLEAAEEWARARGRAEMVAGYTQFNYRFYPSPGHLSEHLVHLTSLLWAAGYGSPDCDLVLHWPEFTPPDLPTPDLDFDLVREEGPTRPSRWVTFHALQGGREIGECKMRWLGGPPWRPQYAEWCYCGGLYVTGACEGRGLGKYLLAQGLAAMRAQGAKHTLLQVHAHNHRASLLYANFGYRLLDRTFGFRKPLG